MLEELNLDSCIVGDSGIAHLADNNVMPNLTTLDLADTNITDVAMTKIAQFKEMRHLSLFYCNISNRGTFWLFAMICSAHEFLVPKPTCATCRFATPCIDEEFGSP